MFDPYVVPIGEVDERYRLTSRLDRDDHVVDVVMGPRQSDVVSVETEKDEAVVAAFPFAFDDPVMARPDTVQVGVVAGAAVEHVIPDTALENVVELRPVHGVGAGRSVIGNALKRLREEEGAPKTTGFDDLLDGIGIGFRPPPDRSRDGIQNNDHVAPVDSERLGITDGGRGGKDVDRRVHVRRSGQRVRREIEPDIRERVL